MLRKITLAAVAVASLGAASFTMTGAAEAHPNHHHWKRWHHHHRHCTVKKVWRHHHWVKKTVCWVH